MMRFADLDPKELEETREAQMAYLGRYGYLTGEYVDQMEVTYMVRRQSAVSDLVGRENEQLKGND